MKHLDTVAVVGPGLIGGSIGLALRKHDLADKVIGIGRKQMSLRIARRVGAVTNTTIDLAKGVADAELVIVCTPVGQIVDDVLKVAEHCPPGTLITDVGGAKGPIVAALDENMPRDCRFLGGHPLAGSEKAGAANASADLFDGRVALITPTLNTRAEDYDLIEEFWEALGSVVIKMTAEEHDQALALTSHLPHLAASALAERGCLRRAPTSPSILPGPRVASGVSPSPLSRTLPSLIRYSASPGSPLRKSLSALPNRSSFMR